VAEGGAPAREPREKKTRSWKARGERSRRWPAGGESYQGRDLFFSFCVKEEFIGDERYWTSPFQWDSAFFNIKIIYHYTLLRNQRF
jgi:hypothetical protein